ncbi:MAG: M12 family metallo-peptidase [Acidobacteria bacterium]|nr:M12 family metallo-peptidase [Acidobacteriota bacterium]
MRSAPRRLEFEAPDGRVLAPEMRVFEDRGDGNAMWVGGYPEAGYDSVLLTLQDGHLVGRLGLPEGDTYWIRSPADGFGRLTEGGEASARACGGGVVPDADPAARVAAAARADTPRRVASASNHDRLDILILYTASARQRLEQAGWGPPAMFTQHAMDYLNLVFRNNQVAVTANMVHQEEAPAGLGQFNNPLDPLTNNREVHDLRVEHEADLVHLFFNADAGLCGQAWVMTRGHTAANFWGSGYGITSVAGGCVSAERLVRPGEHANHVETFAHEIGHNLGGNHDPDNTGVQRSNAVYPYAYGHHNFTPQPNRKSVMSYNEGRQMPFFSTVRVKPDGYTLGVKDERENERAVQQTIHIAVRLSDHLPEPGEPPPPPPPPGDRPDAPTDVSVIATASTSVKVTWTDASDNEHGFHVHARLAGAGWRTVAEAPANAESADVDGLRAGGRYDFRVRAWNRSGGRNSGVTTIILSEAEYTNCVPSASQITFEHGFSVSMCVEYRDPDTGQTVAEDAQNYGLESSESGILYFFDRDNAEVLVKVLNTCAISDYYWVYVAPVTDLAFNLHVDNLNVEESAPGRRWTHRNPKGGTTATTRSDNRAFPCETSASTVAVALGPAGTPGLELVDSGFPVARSAIAPPVFSAPAPVGVTQAIAPNEATDCEPEPVATLADGYIVNMCVEYLDSATGEPTVTKAQDYGLKSKQSGLLYFFNPNNAEVLIKVLDTCSFAPYRWVYVAPVTDLAFDLTVVSPNPDDEVWRHSNRLGQTAAARSDNKAFPCGD